MQISIERKLVKSREIWLRSDSEKLRWVDVAKSGTMWGDFIYTWVRTVCVPRSMANVKKINT